MKIQGIPCKGEQPPVKKFMDHILVRYGIQSMLSSNGTWSFDGTDDAILKLVQDMFSLDGAEAALVLMTEKTLLDGK